MDSLLGFQIESFYNGGRVYCHKGLLLVGLPGLPGLPEG